MSGKTLTYDYVTRYQEVLDEIVSRHYGSLSMLQDVLNVNPGLAKRGPTLPEGITIFLPSMPKAEKKTITLWG